MWHSIGICRWRDVYQLFFCKCKVALSTLGIFRRKAIVRTKRLADIVTNTSR